MLTLKLYRRNRLGIGIIRGLGICFFLCFGIRLGIDARFGIRTYLALTRSKRR